MKVVIWCMVSVGLLPCLFLALPGLFYWQFRGTLADRDVIVRNEYLRVGPWSCDWHPRFWAFALLAAGIVAVVVAVAVLLHVPKSEGSSARIGISKTESFS